MTLGRGGQQLAAGVGLVLALGGLAVQAPAQQAPPVKAPPAQSPPPNQLAGVTLAKGTKPGNPFGGGEVTPVRSEEHTSELQSLAYLVCRLLLEKKKKNNTQSKQSQHDNSTDHNTT